MTVAENQLAQVVQKVEALLQQAADKVNTEQEEIQFMYLFHVTMASEVQKKLRKDFSINIPPILPLLIAAKRRSLSA